MNSIVLSSEIQKYIEENIINPDIVDEITTLVSSKKKWKKISDITEALGHVFLAITTILAFTSGIYDYKIISFFTGCTGTISLSLLRFSVYASKECKERNTLLSSLLIRSQVNPLPSPVIEQDLHHNRNNSNRTPCVTPAATPIIYY